MDRLNLLLLEREINNKKFHIEKITIGSMIIILYLLLLTLHN